MSQNTWFEFQLRVKGAPKAAGEFQESMRVHHAVAQQVDEAKCKDQRPFDSYRAADQQLGVYKLGDQIWLFISRYDGDLQVLYLHFLWMSDNPLPGTDTLEEIATELQAAISRLSKCKIKVDTVTRASIGLNDNIHSLRVEKSNPIRNMWTDELALKLPAVLIYAAILIGTGIGAQSGQHDADQKLAAIWLGVIQTLVGVVLLFLVNLVRWWFARPKWILSIKP